MPTKLRMLGPLVQARDTRTVALPPKQADPHYLRPAHKAWRTLVLRRAGYRCEAIDQGNRCTRAWPAYRMYADHIVEIKDGGSLTDLGNGQCLCAPHHKLKTDAVRSRRTRTSLDV